MHHFRPPALLTTSPPTTTLLLLPCVPFWECDIFFGSSHLETFGPQPKCQKPKTFRCVRPKQPTPATTPVPTTPATTPPKPGADLPCVRPHLCAVFFGTHQDHSDLFGPQDTCPDPGTFHCVVTRPPPPTATTPPPTLLPPPTGIDLPCLPPAQCKVQFSPAIQYHLEAFGPQRPCPSKEHCRCIVPKPPTPPTATTPPPSPPSIPVPCLPSSLCDVPFGSSPLHPLLYGPQRPCPTFPENHSSSYPPLVHCVRPRPPSPLPPTTTDTPDSGGGGGNPDCPELPCVRRWQCALCAATGTTRYN